MLTALLHNPQQAKTVLDGHVWDYLRSNLQAGKRIVLEIKQETRSGAENRLLHQLIGQIAKELEWAGAKRDTETWKRLLTAAWCRANNEQIEFLPALDGKGVDIVFRRTSQLNRTECADLIEFVFAWGAEAGVKFPARE